MMPDSWAASAVIGQLSSIVDTRALPLPLLQSKSRRHANRLMIAPVVQFAVVVALGGRVLEAQVALPIVGHFWVYSATITGAIPSSESRIFDVPDEPHTALSDLTDLRRGQVEVQLHDLGLAPWATVQERAGNVSDVALLQCRFVFYCGERRRVEAVDVKVRNELHYPSIAPARGFAPS